MININRKFEQYSDRQAIQRLRNTVRKYPLNELVALISCSLWARNKVSDLLDKLLKEVTEKKALWIYSPSLAKYAILNSNDHVGLSNRDINEALNDLINCILIINEVKDPIPNPDASDAQNELSKFMFHIAQQQFGLQETPAFIKNELARSIVLYDSLPKQLANELNIDVCKAVERIYAMDVIRFFNVLMLFLGGYNGGWRNSSVVENLGDNIWQVTPQELSGFVNKLGLDYSAFRHQAKDFGFSGVSSQFYGYTPFDSHPITIRTNGDFLIISPHYLFKRIYLGIYFDLLKHFQETTDLRANEFSTEFGKIFEEYAWQQFNQLTDDSEVIREFYYRNSKRFTDISLKYGNELILIECKKNRLRLEARYVSQESILKEDLGKSIFKGLKQIANRITDIQNKEEGLERFFNIIEYFPMICTFDDAYLLNDTFVRNMVAEQLAREGITFKHPWQIIKISEVEELIPSLQKEYSFLDMLKEKLTSAELIGMDWQKFKHQKGINQIKNPILTKVLDGMVNK